MKVKILIFGLVLAATNVVAEDDPEEIRLGERVFLETRFAQHASTRQNASDPVLEETVDHNGEALGNPFAGKTMSCRSCHLVDELTDAPAAGMRSYADFARRSPVPGRGDGQHVTPRNSMSLVNISIAEVKDHVFHFDGQFNSMEDLVRGTFTGRNYGWQAAEYETALRHIADVVRNDDGSDELGKEFGGSYRELLSAKNEKLPPEYRLDIDKATDSQVLDALARLVTAYVTDLAYSRDEQDRYNGSPYDAFLAANNLPRQPAAGETDLAYSERLLAAVDRLKKPVFITGDSQQYATHKQEFRFAADELAGMKVFFSRHATGKQRGKTGNCIACHAAPHFSDFRFHNTGISQLEYDGVHGQGSFAKLDIPGNTQRHAEYDKHLPATRHHPAATGRFQSAPAKTDPGLADLGVWNIYANADMPAPQAKLSRLLCNSERCDTDKTLATAIAAFKTPVVRNTGHSAPYFHNGMATALDDVIAHYVTASAMAKTGQIRNVNNDIKAIDLDGHAQQQLVAFLKSLNEDYD